MPTETTHSQDISTVVESSDIVPKTFLGRYTPFAGVNYYAVLNEQDIRRGMNRIGPTGWRLTKASPEKIDSMDDHNLMNETLKHVRIFGGLSNSQLNEVLKLGRQMHVPAGWVLGTAGVPVSHLFIIIKGRAELSARSAIGEITVRVAEQGESFPLAVMIGSGTLITSATAMTEMDLLAFPRSRLLALCHNNTDIGMPIFAAIADVLADRYSKTLSHLTDGTEKVLRHTGYFANV